ncbi:hypothetical protein HID58_030573 [Brassica napus]|uniref:SKP1 component dimerisation domain-containing protein n=1 Tax=Brassica napus TaxID=3708 RepID=A0ABQ8CGA3_BRANA|nr:hypothetical protein HID58_030573 [Brassica napus]
MEMKIRILVDLVSQTLAAMINNKTVWEMRASFNLKDDVTSYVEREWRRKHEWAFESDPLPAVEEEGMPTIYFQLMPDKVIALTFRYGTKLKRLEDDVAELCFSRNSRSIFQIISQVCWRWRRFLRSEHYAAVRKLTGSVEELMCVLVDDGYWEVFECSANKLGRIPPVPGPLKGGFGLAVLDGGKIVFIGGRYDSAA